MKKSVDIIIPIYNAYEDLTICLESIYRNTDLVQNRLILINDNSPDERIKKLLNKQVGKNIIVIHNETNKGFSANINIGISQSEKNDVILLNSDTIVTKNWVEKIVKCAYSDRSIGTVTPLSNNATLCSVPAFCEENKLPNNMSVDQVAEVVERCSMRKYPEITVAHGFCMFVKREVIDTIGNFDAATFGRGYGEENDFCNRAGQVGYKHVMCDDTYILHTGTKSFANTEKAAYIAEHDRILRERYPIQMEKNDIHVRDNPNKFVGDNVSIFLEANNGKKNILYVLQSDFRADASDNVGGTQLHVENLTKHMTDKYNIFVAARDKEFLNLTFYTDCGNKWWKFYIGEKKPYYSFSDRNLDKIWRNVLSAFRIECVHIHHLCTTSFDIVYVANEYKIPIIFTLHDYFMINPSLKLLNEKDEIITRAEETNDSWTKYLEKNYSIYNKIDYMSMWRKRCEETLDMCKEIIVPDSSVKKIVAEYYPTLEERINVIPHGYEFTNSYSVNEIQYTEKVKCYIEDIYQEGFTYKIRGWAYVDNLKKDVACTTYIQIETSKQSMILPTSPRPAEDVMILSGRNNCRFELLIPISIVGEKNVKIRVMIKCTNNMTYCTCTAIEIPNLTPINKANKLNIAFIGGINKEKGGQEIAKLVRKYKDKINWFLFGNIGCLDLESLKQDNYAWFGGYNSEDLPVLMNAYEIDIVCILSIWPETYSYTLTEALLCKKPVIVTNIGALGNRLSKVQCGWGARLEYIQEDLSEIVKSITTNQSILAEYRKKVEEVKIDTLDEMSEKYKELYERYIPANVVYERADYEFLYHAYRDFKHSNMGDNMQGNNSYLDMINEYQSVINTVSYKIAKKIQMMNFPGKETLYKWIKDKVK